MNTPPPIVSPQEWDAAHKEKEKAKWERSSYGSVGLARTLIEHDLVDELRLMVYPVVLGAGERLFGELPDKKAVRLVDTKTVGDGMTILIYEAVRDPGASAHK
jgi:dihydrofolate reductase